MENFIQRADTYFDGVKAAIRGGLGFFEDFFKLFSNFWLSAVVISAVFAIVLIYTILRKKMVFKKNVKNVRTLAMCALLVAINIVLGYFYIPISNYLRIGFGFMTVPIAAALFGPGMACLTGITQDVVSFVLKPTGGYLFTYTLSVGTGALIYGWMLYGKKITFWRVFVTKAVIVVFVNIILSSIALAPTVGAGLIGILPARIIKNLLLLPIQAVIVYFILKITERFKV